MSDRTELSRRDLVAAALALPAAAAVAAGASKAEQPVSAPRPVPLPPPLARDVFRQRQDRLRSAARAAGLDAIFVTPSTNFRYAANLEIGRSERLTALLISTGGRSTVVTPLFERPRSERDGVFDEIVTWQEAEDPFAECARILSGAKSIGIEGSTEFETAERLRISTGARVADFAQGFRDLRSVKSEEEKTMIRAAAARTMLVIEATRRRLAEGMTEKEAAEIHDEEYRKLGVEGDGLVQFGPSSALPHGGPGDRRLARGMTVLIDTGCRVHGYTSDVTRTGVFGTAPDRVRKVYETVAAAQRAGIAALRAGTSGEDVDAAARKVIADAGFGQYFTHRLGHGLGMDGHESPYLVGGNRKPLVRGNVNTVEPGIYLPGEFGIRIEDDFAVTAGEAERLSPRGEELTIL